MDIKQFFAYKLFSLGETQFDVARVATIIFTISVFLFASRFIHRLWIMKISSFESGRRGALESLSRFGYYLVLVLGLMVILHANGIDLTTLTLLTSALGIGIGFGLQAITSNLISGIIILFERPIKVGDRVEIGDVYGDVVSISIRASTILTNDNIAIIVPNSDFITQKVINWSFNDRMVRLHIRIGVAYKSKPKLIKETLLAIAASHKGVLINPAPDVLLEEFGESSVNFSLRVWTQDYAGRPGALKSELNFLIFEAFNEAGIEIPFPQRDVYIKRYPTATTIEPSI